MARIKLTAEERRDRIVKAARQIFLRNGFNGATTRAIARAAGITEAVLYQHFASKEEMFQETMIEPVARDNEVLMSKLHDLVLARSDPEAAHQAESELLREMVRLTPAIGALFYADPQSGRTNYTDLTSPAFAHRVKELVSAGVGSGADLSERVSAFLTMAYGLNLGVALHYHFSEDDLDVEKIAGQLTKLISYGVEQSEGRFASGLRKVAKRNARTPRERFSA